MNYLFFNESHKLRSGWRAAVFLLFFILPATLFSLAETSLITSENGTLFFAVNSFGLLVLSLLLGGIAGKLFENLPFKALGASFTNGWLKHFSLGVVIGAATLCLAVLIAYLFGGEKFELNLADGAGALMWSLVVSLGVFALGAAWEEAFFRGYILQTFDRSGLAWLAIMLTSLIFGVGHFWNPNATVISTANTVLAGVWFSLAYLKTRDLWLVWGMHLMWNWMQGSIFGIEVSGLTEITTTPLLKEIDTGPTWLTGATYGIEGGIACSIALIVSIVVIHYLPGFTTETTETTEHTETGI